MTTAAIIRANLRALLSRDPTDRECFDYACSMLDYMAPAYSEAMRVGMRTTAPVKGSQRKDVD